MKPKFYWAIFGLFIFGLSFYMLFPFLNLFIYALFIYYISRPLYKKVYGKTKSKNLSAFTSLFFLILPILLLSAYLLNITYYELNSFLRMTDLLPQEYSEKISSYLNQLNKLIINLEPSEILTLMNKHKELINFIISLMMNFIDIIFKLFLIFTIGFYFLKDGRSFKEWFLTNFKKQKNLLEKFFNSVDNSLDKVFFGNLLTLIITALLGVLVFNFLNLIAPAQLKIPYPTLLGILSGLAILVPGIGIKLIWIPLAFYLALQSYLNNLFFTELWFLVLFLILVNVVVDFIPDLVFRPRISGKELHPGALMLAYLFGVIVFGWVGLFLGPLLLILTRSFIKVILPEIISKNE